MIEKLIKDEIERSISKPDVEPHEFVGRLDRDCEVCGKPDRNPTHVISRPSNDKPDSQDEVQSHPADSGSDSATA